MRRLRLLLVLSLPLLLGAAPPPGEPVEKRVRRLLGRLDEGDTLAKQDAIAELGGLGEKGAAAVPHLARLLEVRELCRPAAYALARMGPKAGPVLLRGLGDPDYLMRQGVASGLLRAGEKAVPTLLEGLRHRRERVREGAAAVLVQLEPLPASAAPALLDAMKTPHLDVFFHKKNVKASARFGDWREGPDMVVSERRGLDRGYAAEALSRMGPRAVPVLIHALQDPAEEARLKTLVAATIRAVTASAKHLRTAPPRHRLHDLLLLLGQAPKVLDAVEEGHARTRRLAACALGWIGPKASKAVPVLTRALRDGNLGVRGAAADALGRMGPHARPAIPTLLKALKDTGMGWGVPNSAPRAGMRTAAVDALLAIGPAGKEELLKKGVPLLRAALKDEDEYIRGHAGYCLAKLGPQARPALPELVRAFQQRGLGDYEGVEEALRAIGAPAAAALAPLLKAPDETLRQAAVEFLGTFRADARALAPDVIRLTKDPDAEVRMRAISALPRIGGGSKEVVAALALRLKDDNAEVRQHAAEVLGRVGRPAKTGAPALSAAMKDEDQSAAVAAARALVRIGAPPAPPLARLVAALEAKPKGDAPRSLHQLGPRARPAAPALTKLLTHKNPEVQWAAAFALCAVGGEEARAVVPLARRALAAKPRDPERLRQAVEVLKPLGPRARDAVPELVKLLDEGVVVEHSSVCGALEAIGPAARPAVPALVRHLKRDPLNASRALGKIGPGAAAVPALSIQLQDPDASRRADAAQALARIGAPAKAAVPHLRRALEDEDSGTHAWAACALFQVTGERKHLPGLLKAVGQTHTYAYALSWAEHSAADAVAALGAGTPGVVEALTVALKSPDPSVQSAAVGALADLGPAAKKAVPAVIRLLRATGDARHPLDAGYVALALVKIDPTNKVAVFWLRALVLDDQAGQWEEAERTLWKIAERGDEKP